MSDTPKPANKLPFALENETFELSITCADGLLIAYDTLGLIPEADEAKIANVEYIVHACNEYPKLKEQNQKLMKELNSLIGCPKKDRGWKEIEALATLNSIKEACDE